jgi:hypothetical protein
MIYKHAILIYGMISGFAFCLLITCGILLPAASLQATSVNRLSLCNLEGVPGSTVVEKISLISDDALPREGVWETYYRRMDGDGPEMNITSWISIEPREFTLQKEEVKNFTVLIRIPDDAAPGLWGAASGEAGQPGHSGERRTYLYFRDSQQAGNLFTGIMIPVSVRVLKEPGFFIGAIVFLRQNWLIASLTGIILALMVILALMTRSRRSSKSG